MFGSLPGSEVLAPWEEAFIEECEMLRSDQLMNDLEVEGEFVTEKVMREEWGWTELLSNHKIIAELIF